MSNSRIWVIAGALVIIVVLALSGLLGVKPQLDAAQLSNDDRAAVESLNDQHRAEIAALKEQSTRRDAIAAEVAGLRTSVPAIPDLDGLTGQLAQLAALHGVVITAYTPQDTTMFVPSAEIAATVPASVNATNFVVISVSITVEGTRDAALAFVNGLQSGGRLVLVSDLTVGAESDGVTSVAITGLVYALLDTPLVDPAAVAETPAPEAAASE